MRHPEKRDGGRSGSGVRFGRDELGVAVLVGQAIFEDKEAQCARLHALEDAFELDASIGIVQAHVDIEDRLGALFGHHRIGHDRHEHEGDLGGRQHGSCAVTRGGQGDPIFRGVLREPHHERLMVAKCEVHPAVGDQLADEELLGDVTWEYAGAWVGWARGAWTRRVDKTEGHMESSLGRAGHDAVRVCTIIKDSVGQYKGFILFILTRVLYLGTLGAHLRMAPSSNG